MNKMETLACCIALLGCNGNAIAFTEEEAKVHVIAQEKAWSDAVIHHDIAKVASILADDFIGIDGRGFVTDKAAELKEAEPSAADSIAPLLLKEDLSDFTARIYGNTAVLNLTNPVDGKGDYVGSSSFHQTMYWRKTAASDLNIDTLTEERGQISTFDIRVPADVIRQNTKAEGKLSLTADLGPPLNSYIC